MRNRLVFQQQHFHSENLLKKRTSYDVNPYTGYTMFSLSSS